MHAPSPSSRYADSAALAWLVGAGVDALVEDKPRNWLTPPPAPPPVAVPQAALPVAQSAAPRSGAASAAAAAANSLDDLNAAVAAFAHPLRQTGTAPRLLSGNAVSGLLVLGDYPDADDTPAARLQARMLAAIGLDGATSAEAHLLPWATPGGRPPRDDELATYAPFLSRALTLAAPRLILAFGDKAAALCGEAGGVAKLRGRWLAAGGVPMLVTFHPRRLLAQPELKRLAWADLQAFAARRESLS